MRRRLFGSVRARATLGATLVVAVALLAAGASVLLALRSNLTDQASSEAESSARKVAVSIATGTAPAALELPDGDETPVQVVDGDGRLLAASEDLERISGTGSSAVRPVTPPVDDDGDDDGGDDGGSDRHGGKGKGGDDDSYAYGEIADDAEGGKGSATVDGETRDHRFAALEVKNTRQGDLTVYAGASLSAEQSAVGTALTVMLTGFPVLLGVVGAVTWLVTRRALRPVEGIRSEMSAITASQDLARRVPEPATHDEVARLARTTNETLAALETSVERQRRFVADASHELRSPIASLRTQLEVGAAHPELLDVEGAVADTVRLQELAAGLLLLARLDAGERPGRRGSIWPRCPARSCRSVRRAASRSGHTSNPSKWRDRAVSWRGWSGICWTTRSVTPGPAWTSPCGPRGRGRSSRSVTTAGACRRRSGSGSSRGSCAWTTRGPGTTAGRVWDSPSPGTSPCGTAAP